MNSDDKYDGRTHADGCHAWGRNHYGCAVARIAELTNEVDILNGTLERNLERTDKMEQALRWLLEDTQHAGHNCGDSADLCPVLNARLLLGL